MSMSPSSSSTSLASLHIRMGRRSDDDDNDDDGNTTSESSSPSSSAIIHTIQNRHLVASRSEYFESLQSWQPSDDVLDLEPMQHIASSEQTVTAFLQALEADSFENSPFFKNYNSVKQGSEFYQLWLYFGCQERLLESFVQRLNIRQRIELLEQCESIGLDVERLLLLPGYYKDMTQLTVPLDRQYCVSLAASVTLLTAHDQAKPDWSPVNLAAKAWHSGIKSLTGNEKWSKRRLSASGFAMLVLQNFAQPVSNWTVEQLVLVFDHLPPDNKTHTHVSEPKPVGLEALLAFALEHNVAVPDMIKTWNLDLRLVAPALRATNRLDQAMSYPSPKVIVETIAAQWTTPQECCTALETDDGGLARLLDVVDDKNPAQGCAWLAQIPIFVQARTVAQGLIQVTLFRVLFLHVDFEPLLSPELLGTLPCAEHYSVGRRAIEHACLYLEQGMDSPVLAKLPWKQHVTSEQLGRAVKALYQLHEQHGEQSTLWTVLELDKVPTTHLMYIPARILAAYAVMQHRRVTVTVGQLLDRVNDLESRMGKLEQHVREVDRYQVIHSKDYHHGAAGAAKKKNNK